MEQEYEAKVLQGTSNVNASVIANVLNLYIRFRIASFYALCAMIIGFMSLFA